MAASTFFVVLTFLIAFASSVDIGACPSSHPCSAHSKYCLTLKEMKLTNTLPDGDVITVDVRKNPRFPTRVTFEFSMADKLTYWKGLLMFLRFQAQKYQILGDLEGGKKGPIYTVIEPYRYTTMVVVLSKGKPGHTNMYCIKDSRTVFKAGYLYSFKWLTD